jgi:translation initiation factor 2 subunit 2
MPQEAANGESGGEEEAAGLDLSLGKKKKKRKPKARTDEEFGALVEEAEGAADGDKENENDGLPSQPKLPWEGSDRDYTYQELLGERCCTAVLVSWPVPQHNM